MSKLKLQFPRIVNSVSRRLIVQTPILNSNKIIINEFPKSGGTWLSNMVGDSLGLPFPRNSLPRIGSCIMHGHYMKCNSGTKNRIVLWRDGRDVMVSWYYHCLFANEIDNYALVKIVERDLGFIDKQDICSNLPLFIEYSFTRQRKPSFNWSQFVQAWIGNPEVIHTSYEKLRLEPNEELSSIVESLTGVVLQSDVVDEIVRRRSFAASKDSLASQAGVSFLRKGIIGDWKNCFNQVAVDTFKHYAGSELIKLGYETNNKWGCTRADTT